MSSYKKGSHDNTKERAAVITIKESTAVITTKERAAVSTQKRAQKRKQP